MKIGLFTATYLDMDLQTVRQMAAKLGYEAVELPAFTGNPHLDIDDIVKGANARNLAKMIHSHGIIISALSNHPEGQLVLGPYGKDTDHRTGKTRLRRRRKNRTGSSDRHSTAE